MAKKLDLIITDEFEAIAETEILGAELKHSATGPALAVQIPHPDDGRVVWIWVHDIFDWLAEGYFWEATEKDAA